MQGAQIHPIKLNPIRHPRRRGHPYKAATSVAVGARRWVQSRAQALEDAMLMRSLPYDAKISRLMTLNENNAQMVTFRPREDFSLPPTRAYSEPLPLRRSVGMETLCESATFEDGVHVRINALPPLANDPYSTRQQQRVAMRMYASYDDLPYDVTLYRRPVISEAVDRKVVTYLRRKLNRRLERRYNQNAEAELQIPDSDEDHGNSRDGRSSGKTGESPDIFHKYTDYGDRIKRHGSALETIPDTEPPEAGGGLSTKKVPLKSATRSVEPKLLRTPLPEIGINTAVTGEAPSQNKDSNMMTDTDESSHDHVSLNARGKDDDSPADEEGDATGKETTTVADSASTVGGESVVFELTKITATKVQPEEEVVDEVVDFREAVISPVPTPHLFRPETRENGRVSMKEKVQKVLGGHMNVKVEPNLKLVRIYLHSHFTDSDSERSTLIEKVYPQMKWYFAERGYTLQILDTKWGLRDFHQDDQGYLDLVTKVIELCHQNTRGINFITFLNDKYGEAFLPSSIEQHEFERILDAISTAHQRELEASAALAAVAEHADDTETSGPEGADAVIPISRRVPVMTPEESAPDTSRRESRVSGSELPGAVPSCLPTPASTLGSERRGSLLKRTASKVIRLNSVLKGMHREHSFGANSEFPDAGLLQSWYELDDNAMPPVYRLSNISDHHKDFTRNDASKRAQARSQWLQTYRRLQGLFFKYAQDALDEDCVRKYGISLLEHEFDLGAFSSIRDPGESIFWFKREVPDIRKNMADENLRDFLDLRLMAQELDPVLTSSLNHLKDTKYPDAISVDNVWRYAVRWHPNGISPLSTRSHVVYMERMCKEFANLLKKKLDDCLGDERNRPDMTSELFREVVQHTNYVHARCRSFHGRKNLLHVMKCYVRSDFRFPLVIHGQPGSGKTSLLAKGAKEAYKWCERQCAVVVRMIGVTPQSTNIRQLLKGICKQICHIYEVSQEDVPNDYQGLQNDFLYRLSLATEERPLVIAMDSLNRLSDKHDGRRLGWLPKDLPPHVHLILTTVPSEKFECFPKLQKDLEKTPGCFLEVPPLPMSDAVAILEHWLNQCSRTVTDGQHDVILEFFKGCPLPLYLRTVFNEAVRWRSSLPADQIKLAGTVKGVLATVFGRCEKDCREPLVRRALGYITASKHGVTDTELEDLLSLDEAVMDDVMTHFKPPMRRLPTILWLRLRIALGDYLEETIADDSVLLRWSHSQFFEAAEERYLLARDKAQSYHKSMAEYFQDLWSEKPKPCAGKEKAALRFILPQPLYRETTDPKTGRRRVYNYRRLSELPFHLLRSQQFDVMKKECLCNFEFILVKLCATSLGSVFEDIQMALTVEPADGDLKLLSDTLLLSSDALSKDPRQLASQVVGRLFKIITADVPVAPADPINYPFMKFFYRQAKKSPIPNLRPSMTCLTPPGGILFDLLSGHTEPITAVITTTDGQRAITTAMDNTLKLWELRSGKVVRTIAGVGAEVLSIRMAAGNALAITSELTCIRIWSMRTGQLVKTIDDYEDPASVTTALEGQLLVAFFDGAGTMRVWDLRDVASGGGPTVGADVPLIKEVDISDDGDDVIHVDRSILVALNSNGPQVMYAYRGCRNAYVRNVLKGRQVFCLAAPAGAVSAVAVSRDYFIMAVRLLYMKLHEIYQLEIYDLRNGKHVRSVRGCVNDHISELYVNQLGSHALALCTSEATEVSDIALYNLETEEHKHLARHSPASTSAACIDTKYCLTASRNSQTLRIWNLSSKMNQPQPKEKAKEGIAHLLPMPRHPQYVIAQSMNRTVTVWNVRMSHCAGVVVRQERGLVDPNDILIIRDTKVAILTDKGFSNVSESAPPIYKTVIVYDLLEKKYESRVEGCYIVPSPPHEYVFLDDEKLMGLADNRGHFVIWSVVSGQVIHRIKCNFKDREFEIKDDDKIKRKRDKTAAILPWERRKETGTARMRRHKEEMDEERRKIEILHKEKDNSIEQYIISRDMSTIIASFYGHHMCVFDLPSLSHVQTLENPHSMLLLHVAALTDEGSHLVHANYDEESKISYVTLWDCRTGTVKKRLKNERSVCAIAISDRAEKVVFGKTNQELRIWRPGRSSSMTRIKGYSGLNFGVDSQIVIIESGQKAIVYAGEISMWDLDNSTILTVFTPDMKIQGFTVALDGQLIVFGLRDTSDIVTLRLCGQDSPKIEKVGTNLFQEEVEEVSDESDDEDDGDEQEEDEDD